ncbi:MAG: hypothetical protein PVH43_08855 [Desulfobacterales bacterium]
MRPHILLAVFLSLALLAGFLISQYPPNFLIWGVLALILFLVAFLNVEWGLYILIFSMLLSPEISIGETTGASLGRGVTLRFEDFLLVIIGFGWFAKNAVNKELGLFLKTPLNKAIFLYIITCIVSTGFGIMEGRVGAKTGSLFVLKYIEYFIVFFMVVNHVKSTDQVKRLVFCIFLTCFIASFIGIFQISEGVRVSAPFEGQRGEPNTFGGYLLFMGAILFGIIIKTENRKLKYSLILLSLVIIPPFLFTQSRSSYLGLIPVCLILGSLTNHRIITVGLLLAGFLLSPLFLPIDVKNRILYTFTQPEEAGQISLGGMRLDTSTSARIASLKEILKDWPKQPLMGYGVTGYKFADAQYPRVLIETGLFGMLAFLYLIYTLFKLTINRLKKIKTADFKGITIGFLAGFVGLLFHALGANTFIIVRIMEPFWFFAGIIVVLPAIECQSQTHLQKSFHRSRKLAAAAPLSS